MILFWLLFCFIHNLIALTAPSKPGIDLKTKPVMCEYTSSGKNGFNDKTIPDMPPDCMPCECDIIVFKDFSIDNKSSITCDTKLLQTLTSIRPVIICVYPENGYNEWASILKNDKLYTKAVETLIDFAKKTNVIGYKLQTLAPEDFMETLNKNVGIKIIDYIKKLKENTNLIVGYSVTPFYPIMNNPCITPFAELNAVVDFYDIRSSGLNSCDNQLYNGLTPIKFMEHSESYMMSMEEVWKFLEESECDLEKVYLTAEIIPKYTQDFSSENNKYYANYNQICSGLDIKEMCVPDTNELYAKGIYIKQVRSGLIVKYVNLDNFDDSCGCGTFIGTRNLCAGYNGKEKIPCAKFDVQKAPKGSE